MGERVVLRGPGYPDGWVVDGGHWAALWRQGDPCLNASKLRQMEHTARQEGWRATANTLRACLLAVGGDAHRLLAYVVRESLWVPPPNRTTASSGSVGVARGVVGALANDLPTDVWEGRHE